MYTVEYMDRDGVYREVITPGHDNLDAACKQAEAKAKASGRIVISVQEIAGGLV